MKIRRWSVAGLAAAALLAPALTACGPETTDKAAGQLSPTPADAKQVLIASTDELSKGNFRFTMTGEGVSGHGMVHSPSHSAQYQMKVSQKDFSMEMEFIYIEPDGWVKLDLGDLLAGLPGVKKLNSDKYLHLDQSKVKGIKDLSVDFDKPDPAGSDILVNAIVDVRQTGEGTYTGKIDLSKATDADLVDDDVVKALGAQAKALPFEAKLDAQGRLSELTVQVPAAREHQAHELKITYHDYGAASAPEKPAPSEVEEAPAEAYNMFK